MTRNSVKRLSLTFCLQQRHRQIWPSLYIDTHRAFNTASIYCGLSSKTVLNAISTVKWRISRTVSRALDRFTRRFMGKCTLKCTFKESLREKYKKMRRVLTVSPHISTPPLTFWHHIIDRNGR